MAKEKIEQRPIVNPGELGSLLLEYREKIGYSLLQMADALCLSENTIQQLEDENFDVLPEPPYIRGYLRNYAKLADSDPDALITRYEALRGADPSELDYHFTATSTRSSAPKRISPVFGQLIFLALLVALLAGVSMVPAVNNWITETWASFSDQTASLDKDSSDNPLLTGSMPVPIPLPGDEKPVETAAESTNTPSPAVASEKAETPASTDAQDDKKPAEKVAEKTEETTPPKEAEEKKEETMPTTGGNDIINIKLVFNKEVWMRIRDANKKTLFEATNSAGNEKILDLKKPLTFRVGNAQGLSLFVDGKAVDIKNYIKGSVANFTLE